MTTANAENLAAAITEAEQAHRAAAAWAARSRADVDQLAAHLADDGPDGHGQPVRRTDADSGAALGAMHAAAHAGLVSGLVRELHAELADVAIAACAGAERIADELDYMAMVDPGFGAWQDRREEERDALCGAPFEIAAAGRWVATRCDAGDGHYPHTDHEAPDPWGTGRRITYRDGADFRFAVAQPAVTAPITR